MKHSDPAGIRLIQWSLAPAIRRLKRPRSGWNRFAPSPPSDGGEGRGEEERFVQYSHPDPLAARCSPGAGENFWGFRHATAQGLRLFFAALFLLQFQFASVAQVSNL